MPTILRLSLILLLLALPAQAQDRAAITAMGQALRLTEIVDIMRREGLASADDLATNMLGGPTPAWRQALDLIYDPVRMEAMVLERMAPELTDDEAAQVTAFYTSELGARIAGLEITAREAIMDDGIEEVSNEVARALPETDADRFLLVQRFISANGLLESNVVGALNSNYAFYTGLADGGALGDGLSEQEMLNDIWGQEPEIRANTELWLQSYIALAYQPLTDEELQLYIDFSETRAGQAMNQALFAGFDSMFNQISRALGLTLGRLSGSEEL